MQIRAVTANDVPALLTLVERYWDFEGIPGYDPIRLAPQLEMLAFRSHIGHAWIAFENDQPVGYLIGVYVFSLEHAGLTAEIDEFFVLPEHRAQGVGSALLRVAETAFLACGCTNVSLQLAHGNDSARAFYRRNGYAERSGYDLLDKMLD